VVLDHLAACLNEKTHARLTIAQPTVSFYYTESPLQDFSFRQNSRARIFLKDETSGEKMKNVPSGRAFQVFPRLGHQKLYQSLSSLLGSLISPRRSDFNFNFLQFLGQNVLSHTETAKRRKIDGSSREISVIRKDSTSPPHLRPRI